MLKAVAVWDDFRPDVDSRLDSELIYFNVTEYALQSTEWPVGERLFPEGLELDCEVLSDESFPAFIGRLSHRVAATLSDNDIMSQWCSDTVRAAVLTPVDLGSVAMADAYASHLLARRRWRLLT